MSECVARRAAAIGSLILPAVAPAAAHHLGSGGKTGSGGPVNTISAEGKIAAAACYEFIGLGQLDGAALLASAEHGRHSIRSIESVSLSAAYGITNDFMVAIRIPHMRRSDIRQAAEEHRGRPRPNDDVVVGDAHPANGSRTAVARRFA
jgi:hypothetical protein